jgi:hypothetical protein
MTRLDYSTSQIAELEPEVNGHPEPESDARVSDVPDETTKPTITIADALAKNAANREKLIGAARDSIKQLETAKAEYDSEIDAKIAEIRLQIGDPDKARKTRQKKAEPVAPAPVKTRAKRGPKGKPKPEVDFAAKVALMELDRKEPYAVAELKQIFGGKPGPFIKPAMAAKAVKKVGGKGAGSIYRRVK